MKRIMTLLVAVFLSVAVSGLSFAQTPSTPKAAHKAKRHGKKREMKKDEVKKDEVKKDEAKADDAVKTDAKK